jgi:2-iminobutanoate/2-iminopropanoate deaminase
MVLLICSLASAAAQTTMSKPARTVIRTSQAPEPIGPYSQAVRAGNLLFVSGQIALDALSGELVNANIHVETKQVMRNLKAILEEAGAGLNDVVKATIYLRDLEHFAAVNEVYGTFFQDAFPARETVQVSRLPRDVNIEISVVAVVE